uniref:Uncharacterized protein n=1 Tax=Chromera velia CCMP2878 TaxID=1169474 RepID=A0A0G4I005_9ALVE|eukprot:Cvel_9818.t1-p1 / transcript=Cvel_9818.t1 / gene=Cvel_9818 / organism=Chromera_velia_CCMP2878 / gene_product=hypothetical protein / transcript_product=hypothetical protein / location=Cvel_scaffold576:44967-48807(-) / protein_length=181 / sequence_SO=supercontig / SO=protein_coding / is_pseudo=false
MSRNQCSESHFLIIELHLLLRKRSAAFNLIQNDQGTFTPSSLLRCSCVEFYLPPLDTACPGSLTMSRSQQSVRIGVTFAVPGKETHVNPKQAKEIKKQVKALIREKTGYDAQDVRIDGYSHHAESLFVRAQATFAVKTFEDASKSLMSQDPGRGNLGLISGFEHLGLGVVTVRNGDGGPDG